MATDENQHGSNVHAIAGYLLSLVLTFFYIQAFRDIVISPGGFEAVEYIVYTIAAAPLLAGFLNLIPVPRLFVLLSAAAVLAGRWLLLQPSVPAYYRGEYLTLGGFGFFFVSYLMLLAKRHGQSGAARFPVAMFSAGFLSAPILHLALRTADSVQNDGIIIFMIVVGAISLLLSIFPGCRCSGEDTSSAQSPSFTAGLSIFLIAVPIHFVFQWVLRPELFTGITDVSYLATVSGVKIAMCLGAVAAFAFAASRSAFRPYQLMCALVLVSTHILGLLFNLPFGMLSLVLILLALAVVASSLSPILMYFTARAVRCRALFLGFGVTASVFATLGLTIYLLEHHDPNLNWYLLGFLTAGFVILALASRKHLESGDAAPLPKAAAAVAIVIAICFVIYGGNPAQRDISDAGRKVVASLYTWYGVPGKPFGDFGMEALTRPAAVESWSTEKSTVENIKPMVQSSYIPKQAYLLDGSLAKSDSIASHPMGEMEFLSFTGVSDGAEQTRIAISSEANTDVLNTHIRDYFVFIALFDDRKVDAAFYVRKGGILYTKPLQTLAFPEAEHRLIFPQEFESAPDEGPNEIGFKVECLQPGPCEFAISDLKVSRWKHWNEDYHAAEIDGVWYNDPPHTLAATHRANYDGRPWPEIEPYSPDGYYDSWEPRVVRSQLQLMEKAGIDGVMIMHPHSEKIVQMILDTLDELDSPLQILYYGGYNVEAPGHNIAIIKKFGPHPRFMKVGGRPVWVVGPTGLQAKPYKIYEEELAKLRWMTGAFIVGDQYVPPKEEMLPLLDGHYYYDTTGLYRARWGGANIEVAQPDGAFVTGFGNIDVIFRSISKMVHARNQLFIATVIPGFDNVCVHGFLGSPLEDGRPGTIVKRHGGATCAETWKAAIRSGAGWACIVSWNELHEGSGVEPTKEHGVFYVKETARWAEAFRAGKIP